MLCKKCGGARTTNWNLDEFSNPSPGGQKNLNRRYNTVRINRPLPDFNVDLDPYMLMRKSRFKNRSGTIEEKNDQLVSKNASRKSILECHVNPYDLIKFNKYYDTGQQGGADKSKRDINTGCKINKILDTTENMNTTNGGNKKIAKLLNKFKFKTSSSATAANPNIRIAGHAINIHHSGSERVTPKISEEFVKDSSESEDLDEPEVDYSDVELEKHDLPAENNQNKELSNEQIIRKSNRNNELSPVRHNQTADHTHEHKLDHAIREREYKSQSFNHYTDRNIFSQRKHSMHDTMKYTNSRYLVEKSNESISNKLRFEKERRTNTNSKLNDNTADSVGRNNIKNISNNDENDINNRLRNFTINESVISRHYNGNKRHSFDVYRMSELQQMMAHEDSSQIRHSVSDAPNVTHLQNSSSNHQSRPNLKSSPANVSTLSRNSNRNPVSVSFLSRSSSQISTSSSHKLFHRDSDDGENKIDLLETEIKPIPRISVKSPNVKSNTLTPVRPPRKSKSIDCTYRSTHHLTTNDNQKPRAYSMDRTNSISQLDFSRQQTEDIVVIRTNKNDTIKKYKETNQNKLNMSTFKYDTSDNNRTGDIGSGRDYYEINKEDDDLDENYILRSTSQVKDKGRNQTIHSSQQSHNRLNSQQQSRHSNTRQRKSSTSSTHSADYQTISFAESRAKVNPRRSSLTSDQIMDIRAHFNTIRRSPNKSSSADDSKSNASPPRNESQSQNQIKPKEKSPQPDQVTQQVSDQNDIQSRNAPKSSIDSANDRDETGSDFVYDFFIHRSNKFNSISSTTSTEIKSILKKKLDEDLMYNTSVISSNDSTSGSSSVLTSSGNVTGMYSYICVLSIKLQYNMYL